MTASAPHARLGLTEVMRARSKGFISYGLIVRIAAATTVSYLLSREYSGSTLPLFAPITTLLVVQASPFSTLGMTAQRVLGTVFGVAAATVYVNRVPLNWFTVFVALLLALLAAKALPVGLSGQLQLPLAAMFVIALGPTDYRSDYWRVLDVLMGAAVGVLAVFVAPSRPRLQPAVTALQEYLDDVVGLLREMAQSLAGAKRSVPVGTRHDFVPRSRGLGQRGLSTAEAIDEAVESTRFNLRRNDIDVNVADLHQQLAWMNRLTVQVRSLVGAIDRLYDRDDVEPALSGPRLASLLRLLADLIDTRGSSAGADVGQPLSDELARELRDAAQATPGRRDVSDVLGSIGVLARVAQLRELAALGPGSEEDIEQRVSQATSPPVRPRGPTQRWRHPFPRL
ncbi:MAG TPA: FUSC family protein [Candidatus Nanopelagicales bacterium]